MSSAATLAQDHNDDSLFLEENSTQSNSLIVPDELSAHYDDVVTKYDKTVANAMYGLMVEEAEKRVLARKLGISNNNKTKLHILTEAKKGIFGPEVTERAMLVDHDNVDSLNDFISEIVDGTLGNPIQKALLQKQSKLKNITTGALHSFGSLFSKKDINYLLNNKNERASLEAHAKQTLGILPNAMNALNGSDVKMAYTIIKGSDSFKDLKSTPEFFGLLRYIADKKITITADMLSKMDKKITTARDLFGEIALMHLRNKKEKDTDISDNELLDENFEYSAYIGQYKTIEAMNKVEQSKDFVVKENGEIKATRIKHWKKVGVNGGYIALGMAARALAVATVSPVAIPLAVFAGPASISVLRALNRNKKEKLTPTYFNKTLFSALADSYAEIPDILTTKKAKESFRLQGKIVKKFTTSPIDANRAQNYIKEQATLGELEILYATIAELLEKEDPKVNSTYLGYIGQLQDTIFEEIYKKSKKVPSERVTIISLAKNNKNTENILSANMDELLRKEKVDGESKNKATITKEIEQFKSNDTAKTILKSFGNSLLFFGLGHGVVWGYGAAKEFFHHDLTAVVDPIKAVVPDNKTYPALTESLVGNTAVQEHSAGATLGSGLTEKVAVAANHTVTDPVLDPSLQGMLPDTSTSIEKSMAQLKSIEDAYKSGAISLDEAKAKAGVLLKGLNAEDPAVYAAKKAAEGAKTVLDSTGPTGAYGITKSLRSGATWAAAGLDHYTGIDIEKSIFWGDWTLYNNVNTAEYSLLTKSIAATTDIAKNALYLGITEPLEKFARLQGVWWEMWGFKNNIFTDFEVDAIYKKITSTIFAAGGADAFDGAEMSDIRNMLKSMKNDPENMKALLSYLAISGVIGTIVYKKNKDSIQKFWASTKATLSPLKKVASNNLIRYPAILAAPALFLWKWYPLDMTTKAVQRLLKGKAAVPQAA